MSTKSSHNPAFVGEGSTASALLPIHSPSRKKTWLAGGFVSLDVGNQPHPRLIGEICIRPFDQHHDPVAESNQVREVDGQPEEPGQPAGKSYLAEIGDRARASDRGEITLVPVVETLARLAPKITDNV